MTLKMDILGVVCLLGAVGAAAQVAPVTASVRNINEIIVDGKVVERHVYDGVLSRSSKGEELHAWRQIDGKPPAGDKCLAVVRDENGTSYKVDYAKRLAYKMHTPSGKFDEPWAWKQSTPKPVGKDQVDNISCDVLPMFEARPDKSLAVIGRHCRSTKYGLEMKWDSTENLSHDRVLHNTYTLYDVHVGTEPDSSLFDLSKLTVREQ